MTPRSSGRRKLSPGRNWQDQTQHFDIGGLQGGTFDPSLSDLQRMLLIAPPELKPLVQAAITRKQYGLSAVAVPGSMDQMPGVGTPGSTPGNNLAQLKNLQNQGPATLTNTLGPAALAGLTGLSSGYKGANVGAGLVGAGAATLLNLLLRRNNKAPGEQIGTLSNTPTDVTGGPATIGGGDVADAAIDAGPSSFDAGISGMGDFETAYARGGDVHSDAAEDRAQTLGILKEKHLVKARGGRVSAFAQGGAEDLSPAKKPMGKAILLRKPLGHHMPIPVISTTIVISHKPKKAKAKPTKKKRGGPIKASALPPKKGPGNGDGPPAPFRKGGHVQVPRGTGVAIRGKRFAGIY